MWRWPCKCFPHLLPDCSIGITECKLADITKSAEFENTSNEILNAYQTDIP